MEDTFEENRKLCTYHIGVCDEHRCDHPSRGERAPSLKPVCDATVCPIPRLVHAKGKVVAVRQRRNIKDAWDLSEALMDIIAYLESKK